VGVTEADGEAVAVGMTLRSTASASAPTAQADTEVAVLP
jgi:hypothetical protein